MNFKTFSQLTPGDVVKVASRQRTEFGAHNFAIGQLVTYIGRDSDGDPQFKGADRVNSDWMITQILTPDEVETPGEQDRDDTQSLPLGHTVEPQRITAAELREGDVVGMHGDTHFTVERVWHHHADYHEVVWKDTNAGRTYGYEGSESWPLISRKATNDIVFYASQDVPEGRGKPLSTWSVYREEYAPDDLDNPLDDLTFKVATVADEATAHALAEHLYSLNVKEA